MRQRKTFRPAVSEPLEDRTVPSGAGGGGGGLSGLIGLGATTQTKAVQLAFQTFEHSYANDVFNVLYATGGPSTTTRAAFDTQVGTDLTTLEGSIATALGSNATLIASIDASLTGPDTATMKSLQTELNAIATPTTGTGHHSGGPWRFLGQGEYDNAQARHAAVQQVQTATTPANAISVATVQTVLRTVESAYDTFQTTYNNDVKTILYGTGGPSATTRAAFDAKVATDIGTLTSSVNGALSTLPASVSASLTTTLTADLQSSGASDTTSLQAKLAAITTPASTNYFAKVWFRINSNWTSGSSHYKVNSDIISAVKAYNTSPPPV